MKDWSEDDTGTHHRDSPSPIIECIDLTINSDEEPSVEDVDSKKKESTDFRGEYLKMEMELS